MLAAHTLDPQFAPRRAEVARLSLAADLEPHPALDPGGDVDLQVHGGGDPPRASAAWARVGDPHPLAAARRAGGGHLEEPTRLDDLPLAAAVVARGRDRPLPGPRPLKFVAVFLPVEVD